MRSVWAALGALTLVGCGETQQPPEPTRDWCEEFYATFNISDHIDPRTGLFQRSSITQREEDCVRRESQKAIDAYEGNGT